MLTVSQVQDAILSGVSNMNACAVVPVCGCEFPPDSWVQFWRLMRLATTEEEALQLKQILCCVIKGQGTAPMPLPPGPPSPPSPPAPPPGPGGDAGAADCKAWVKDRICSTTNVAMMKAGVLALKLARDYGGFDPSTNVMIDKVIAALKMLLDLCEDPDSIATKAPYICAALMVLPKSIPGVAGWDPSKGDSPLTTIVEEFKFHCCGG